MGGARDGRNFEEKNRDAYSSFALAQVYNGRTPVQPKPRALAVDYIS